MATRAVLFDLDDTLVMEHEAEVATFHAVAQEIHRQIGLDPESLVNAIRRIARQKWHESPTYATASELGISYWEGLWGRFSGLRGLEEWAPAFQIGAWEEAVRHLGVKDNGLGARCAALFGEERRRRHQLFPDVLPCMARLAGTVKLGIITNGASDVQREKIAGSDLGRHFDLILASGDIGIGKPDRRIFEHALKELAVNASEAVMIGDHVGRDVNGAQQVGIKGLWLDRERATMDHSQPPDGRLESLADLFPFL